MVALALILLVLVAVLVVAIVVSNPQTYELSIFGAVVPANSAGIFLTGAAAMAVTIVALLLLRTGVRRARARRKHLKELEASPAVVASDSPSPAATTGKTTQPETTPPKTTPPGTTQPETSKGKSPDTSKEQSALELERESSTTAAERQAMLKEADELTREEPRKPSS